MSLQPATSLSRRCERGSGGTRPWHASHRDWSAREGVNGPPQCAHFAGAGAPRASADNVCMKETLAQEWLGDGVRLPRTCV